MTSSPGTPDPTRTAYHEAGHAIVAHALGQRVKRMEILENLSGTTEIPWPDETGSIDVDLQIKRIAVMVAGYVAEEMAMRNNDRGTEYRSAVERVGLVLRIEGHGLRHDEPEAVVAEQEGRARGILTDNRQVMDELALELEQRKFLTGDSLNRFLRRVRVT